jgi:myosin regulatory light chain 12
MFSPQQVKQFKEAFNMIDQDGDGRVSEADLRTMLTELGECTRVARTLISRGGCLATFAQPPAVSLSPTPPPALSLTY